MNREKYNTYEFDDSNLMTQHDKDFISSQIDPFCCQGVVGRILPCPKDVHLQSDPWNCEYVTFHGKKDLASVIKLKIFLLGLFRIICMLLLLLSRFSCVQLCATP